MGRQVHLCACTHPCTTNSVYSSAKTPFQKLVSCQKILPKMEKWTKSCFVSCHGDSASLYQSGPQQPSYPPLFPISLNSSHMELVAVGLLISKPHSFSLELSGYLFVCLSCLFHQYVETPVAFPSYLWKPSTASVQWSDSHIVSPGQLATVEPFLNVIWHLSLHCI